MNLLKFHLKIIFQECPVYFHKRGDIANVKNGELEFKTSDLRQIIGCDMK
jgi:hypothetical protein